MSSEAIAVRLLINSKTGRVAYAEGHADFLELLYSFLDLPLGSIPRLLALELGSVSSLQESFEKLPSDYMTTEKSRLLDPKFIATYSKVLRIEPGNYYACPSPKNDANITFNYCGNKNANHNFSYTSGETCGACGKPMNRLVQTAQNTNANQSTSSNVTEEVLPYIITDELEIIQNSTITALMLLKKLNIMNDSDIEERTVTVDRNKALGLLKASLVSTTVLNDVF